MARRPPQARGQVAKQELPRLRSLADEDVNGSAWKANEITVVQGNDGSRTRRVGEQRHLAHEFAGVDMRDGPALNACPEHNGELSGRQNIGVVRNIAFLEQNGAR